MKIITNNLHRRLPAQAMQILLLTGFILMQFSCTYFYSPDKYLNDYDSFVTRTEANYETYSEAQWDKTLQKYERFNTELYDRVYAKLTEENQQAIGKLKARFEAVKLKYEFSHLKKDVKDGINQLKGALKKDSVD